MVYYSAPPKFTGIRSTQRVKLPFAWSSNGNTLDATDPGGGNIYVLQQFSLNSLFDPDETGVGHQPRYFDQWSNFYETYRVNGCKVELDFGDVTSDNVGIYIWVSPNNANTPIRTPAPVTSDANIKIMTGGEVGSVGSPFASWNKMSELSYVSCNRMQASGDPRIQTWSRYFNINKILNLKDTNKEKTQGTMGDSGSSPDNEVLLNVLIAKDNNTAFTNGMAMNARLTFYATLMEPKDTPAIS
jgi:hypothetical protein